MNTKHISVKNSKIVVAQRQVWEGVLHQLLKSKKYRLSFASVVLVWGVGGKVGGGGTKSQVAGGK